MPITSSAKKALRRDKRRTKINNRLRSRLRSILKDFDKEPQEDKLPEVYSVLDKAAKKRIIHPNKAARLKAQYTQKIS